MFNKRLLFVITGLGLGGAERQLCILADKFYQRGYEVMILTLSGEIVVRPEEKNIKVINLNLNKTPLSFFKTLFKCRNIIKDYQPSIVHSHMFHANILMRMVGLLFKKNYKLICTAHSKNEGGALRMLIYRLTDKLSDISTNVSKEALEAFIQKKAFSKLNSDVVYNGIDIDKFNFNSENRVTFRHQLNIKENEKVILAVGRLTEAKDYPNLITAFHQLPDYFKMVIIGEGDQRNNIEKLITSLNLSSRVTLLGSINSVSDYYSACDLFVLSSRWEGFGLVVAEAMACKSIAVCTDAGGVKEVVGDAKYVVPISDSQALATKILEMSALSEAQKNIIGNQNRDHIIKNFSITSVVDRWLSIYKSIQVVK
ncbi:MULTISPECIES: glycosyltransferase [unclassified Leclercia]|uniref:glycosyltransferase n=1 Tax=unclassified Leclercia TaxID=2627398 RepID=UPI000DF329BC|nr:MULTISPECIES: glycosyltransferase [unclassified Leclercia]AXF64073.1 glycosyltransferase [Leclercia sp. W17]